MKMRIKGNQNLPCEMKLISKRSQLKVNEIKTNWKTFIAFQTEKLRINAKISSVFAPDFWNTQGTITIAQNAYCSRDIYFQFNKVWRSVISWVDAMKAPQRLVALNALGCSLIWCSEWQTKQRGSSLLLLLLFANRTYAHISQRHFKNSRLV